MTALHIRCNNGIYASLLVCPAHVAKDPNCGQINFTCTMFQCILVSLCKGLGKQKGGETRQTEWVSTLKSSFTNFIKPSYFLSFYT